jgi:hypothetical protein
MKKLLLVTTLFITMFLISCTETQTTVLSAPEPQYKEYVGIVHQYALNPPTSSKVSNDFPIEPRWLRLYAGDYMIVMDSTFKDNKTVIFFGTGGLTEMSHVNYVDHSHIEIIVRDISGNLSDSIIDNCTLILRVYN